MARKVRQFDVDSRAFRDAIRARKRCRNGADLACYPVFRVPMLSRVQGQRGCGPGQAQGPGGGLGFWYWVGLGGWLGGLGGVSGSIHGVFLESLERLSTGLDSQVVSECPPVRFQGSVPGCRPGVGYLVASAAHCWAVHQWVAGSLTRTMSPACGAMLTPPPPSPRRQPPATAVPRSWCRRSAYLL